MRFTLSKTEILRGHKSFTRVLTAGKSISTPPIRCHYIRSAVTPPTVRVGFAVSRRFRRAADRNRVKRLMRESYRLNKHAFMDTVNQINESVTVVFTYVGAQPILSKKLTLEEVMLAMQRALSILSNIDTQQK